MDDAISHTLVDDIIAKGRVTADDVLQLRKRRGAPAGAFDFFAADLRKQWIEDGREDQDLFA